MFDPKTKIWSGKRVPFLYHEEATFGEVVLHNLKKNPDAVIQVSEEDGIELTCDQLKIFAIRFAQNLKKFKISHGKVAGFVTQNTTYLTPALLGCILQGVTFATIDPILCKDHIKHLFKDSKPDIVFCDHDLFEKTHCALKEMNNTSEIFTMTEKLDGIHHVSELIAETGEEDDFVPPRFGRSEDLLAGIICSSATTSLPKGIFITHAQLINLASTFGVKQKDVCFTFSHMYWVSGISLLCASLGNSMKRLCTNRFFDPELTIHLIKKHKVSMIFLPPPHIRAVLKIATKEDLASIRFFITGAAVISDFLLENIRRFMPTAEITNAYGMSEAGLIFSKSVDCDGLVPDNVQLKIVDENRNALGPNQRGVIMVHPLFKFLGYCNAPEKTEAIYKDGWIYTGDYGYMDDKGELTIIDRATELLKCGEELISLSEVEVILEKIETLAESCAIGIPDKDRNHILAALVVKDPGSKLTEADIFKITSENLPPNKHLLGGIFFADELPKTTSGKILRRAVREIIASKIGETK